MFRRNIEKLFSNEIWKTRFPRHFSSQSDEFTGRNDKKHRTIIFMFYKKLKMSYSIKCFSLGSIYRTVVEEENRKKTRKIEIE